MNCLYTAIVIAMCILTLAAMGAGFDEDGM